MPEISGIGILTAFLACAISVLSPCVLPLVPGYVSYIAGRSVTGGPSGNAAALRLPAVGLSACFILGFSTVFILLGASATALGQLLLAYRYELNFVGGAVVILFGLFLIGLLRPTLLMREFRFHTAIPGGRPLSAYVLGLAFAFGWTPCIGPILGAILTVGAVSALGLGVPFLLAALFTDGLAARLKTFGRLGRVLQIAAGLILVLMGIAMMTGQLSAFSYWLLNAFPVLAEIG